MPVKVLIGSQWGDEGKGKIIDVLCKNADFIVRYQGGHNAGHTLVVNNKKYILHLIPSGIHSKKTACVIGNGVLINPEQIQKEFNYLINHGINLSKRLQISSRSHLIFSYHSIYDAYKENLMNENEQIGTTKKGIGPGYSDKTSRCGLRTDDIFHPELFKEKFKKNFNHYQKLIKELGGPSLKFEETFDKAWSACQFLKQFITDTVSTLNQAIKENKLIFCEGAQGAWLDIDYGTYPYVTSSNTGSGGVTIGTGIAPHHITNVLGVAKLYTTRVGKGAFPTELNCDLGKKLQEVGKEYGATTGRPRRCGWFDAVAVAYAIMINGINSLAVTKMDVLDCFKEIKICTAYELNGTIINYVPSHIKELESIRPVYETLPGWVQDTSNIKSFDHLPNNAKKYLKRIEELVKTKITIISTGPSREATFFK